MIDESKGLAAGLLALFVSLSTLATFLINRRKDMQEHNKKLLETGHIEGRREEKEAQMKERIDAAHVKIRALDQRQDEQEQIMTRISTSLDSMSGIITRIDNKLDRAIERNTETQH